jgi:hypothetical protein
MYECFIRYQRQIRKELRAMRAIYQFETINGNRSPRAIANELQAKIDLILNPPLMIEPAVKAMGQVVSKKGRSR